MARLDVIVLGVGAIGSAALYHLACRSRSVLGIDRHSPPHMFGSSHGETRITRTAVGEGVEYSALALRSHALWHDLERATGETLMVQCGCLVITGREASPIRGVADFLGNMQAAARQHGIPHRLFELGQPSAAGSRNSPRATTNGLSSTSRVVTCFRKPASAPSSRSRSSTAPRSRRTRPSRGSRPRRAGCASNARTDKRSRLTGC